ncbi:MAG: rod shape-determining protein RodA [Thermodesulfobacteriota bacterium]|nr:MAG: rod shape-determining protein RodA [Thermodesulfobacteriota bacterium]
MIDRKMFAHFDWLTLSTVMTLTIIGFASVYSATHAQQPWIYQKEVYWIVIGLAFMIVAVVLNYSLLDNFGYVFYALANLSLVLVYIIGSSFGGARRWIDLGFFSLQPSEIAKLALIVVLAKYFSAKPTPQRGLGVKDLVLPGLLMLLPFILIAKQPDLGTGIVLWMIFWSMLLIVRLRLSTIIGLVVTFSLAAPLFWTMLKDYQKARLSSFLNPGADPLGSGYHVLQSKIAIGSGGLFGKGFTAGTQGNLRFLPEHHTDFIFAAFAEEWGLLGATIVLGLFLGLIISGLNTANNSKDRFGFLLAFGITAMFFWQVLINLGMVSGILPVVGVPLPFISYGGSFLITSLISAGLLLNVYMRRFIF